MELEDWLEWCDARGMSLKEHGFGEWLSELIRSEREQAWDEGYSEPSNECGLPCGACELCMGPRSENPYRK